MLPAALTVTDDRRLYALLHVKNVDSEKRVITGIATTPEPDRMGDIVVPTGVTYAASLPLLLHHDKERPVGRVMFKTPTAKGIAFEATLPFIQEPGVLKDRVDEAWSSVKAGLITGVSIGFRVLDDAIELLKTGGLKFLKTEVMELSLVTIPANAAATILTVKSLDQAASGQTTSGVTDSSIRRARKDARFMTIPENITQYSNLRAAKVARMGEIMNKSAADGSTLDEAEGQEYDTLEREVASIQKQLERLERQKEISIETATAITSTTSSATASDLRGGITSTSPRITVTSQLPKGTAFTRFAMAMAAGKGDSYKTIEHAKMWHDSTPEVELMVKAAVAAGTTTDATWAGPLVTTTPINEFLELLRPRTLLGRIPGLRYVPFNVSVPAQTAGGTYGWVGQGAPKPVTSMALATVTVPFSKAAGIIVLTEELVKLSTPSAEATVREEMIAGMAKFLDEQFVDPAKAVAANVSPASITNGASTAAASGVTGAAARLDLSTSVAVFTAANIPLAGSVWLMSDSNAFGLGISLNALGQSLFPGVGIDGGTLLGMPVIVSNNVGNRVILVHAPSILVADEGGVRIDVSREASVQMDSAPSNPADATTVMVSLWQNNLIGLRAERWITWIRARTAAVRYITAAAYAGT